MNRFHEFDKAMSKVCRCGHLRGEHDWTNSLEKCLDHDCGCTDFLETHDEFIIDQCYDKIASDLRTDVLPEPKRKVYGEHYDEVEV